jgi:hypothetical protein
MAGKNTHHRHLSTLFRIIQAFRELSPRSCTYRHTKLPFFRKFHCFHALWPQKSYHRLLFVLVHSISRMINVALYYYYSNDNESQLGANEKGFIMFTYSTSFSSSANVTFQVHLTAFTFHFPSSVPIIQTLRAVDRGMKCLRPLQHWDRGFESR